MYLLHWIRNNNQKREQWKRATRQNEEIVSKREMKRNACRDRLEHVFMYICILILPYAIGGKIALASVIQFSMYTQKCECVHKKYNINNKRLTSMVIDFFRRISVWVCACVCARYTHNKFGTVSMILLFLMFLFISLYFFFLLSIFFCYFSFSIDCISLISTFWTSTQRLICSFAMITTLFSLSRALSLFRIRSLTRSPFIPLIIRETQHCRDATLCALSNFIDDSIC